MTGRNPRAELRQIFGRNNAIETKTSTRAAKASRNQRS
jgi:hypothetical protein